MSMPRNWCFTLFNEKKPFEELPEYANYVVYQQECCPSTGKLHYQGYINLVRGQRLSFLQKRIGNGVHLEVAKGDAKSNKSYCTKEDTRVDGPWEFGIIVEKGSNKRKILEQYQEDPEELRLADPAKYRRCLALVTNKRFNDVEMPVFDRPWQVELSKLLESGSDDRTIIWVYGSKGNEGKSTYAKGLIQKGWFYSRGGKADDVKFQYLEHGGNAVFDIPRSCEDYINYALIEEIKDRIVISNKYEPVTVNYSEKVHVIVMANFYPLVEDLIDDRTGKVVKKAMISKDRLHIIEAFVPRYITDVPVLMPYK